MLVTVFGAESGLTVPFCGQRAVRVSKYQSIRVYRNAEQVLHYFARVNCSFWLKSLKVLSNTSPFAVGIVKKISFTSFFFFLQIYL